MSSYQHSILELRSSLSESQTLLDGAAGVEGCIDLLPDLLRHPPSRYKFYIEEFSELIDLTELLDVWNKYLNEKSGIHPEASFQEPASEAPASDRDPELDLQAALQQCAAAAETGYQKAIAHVTALGAMAEQIEAQANRLAGATRSGDDAEFKKQVAQIVHTLKDKHSHLRKDIDDKRKNLSNFNITLFGRTMTGKSTMMEILTRGDGSSIGKGAQRTTRDVRSYHWKGLTVTDVPGVAAYGGEDDAQTAHQAANQADLVLFLISDDGPQAAEAEHLASLRQQGKSLLGIFNVKEAINANNAVSLRRFLRDHEKLFAPSRLDDISRQFDEMIDRYAPGQEINLVSTHLRARYLAGLPENAGKPWRDDLERASRFQDVETRILREVTANGPFHRTYSFLNIAAAANLQAWESARESAGLCDQAQRRLNDRLNQLRSWQTGFKQRANQRIDHLIQQTVGSLRYQIPAFAEQYCEDRNLSSKWNDRVRNANIDQNCQALQKRLAGECQDYFKQLVADVQQELRLLENQFNTVSMETGPITNPRRRWNWAVSLTSGAAMVGLAALAAANIWNPAGWALAGILGAVGIAGALGNLMGRLFGNRDQKRREAIAKITPELRSNLHAIERQIRDGMGKWLDDFTKQYVNQAEAQFNQLVRSQGSMTNLMRDIADRQHKSLLAVNRDIIEQALQHLGEPDAARWTDRVARIPGQAAVLTTAGNSNLSADTVANLASLLHEQVFRVSGQMSASSIKNALKSLDPKTSERLVAQLV